jgi:hypothetical protein
MLAEPGWERGATATMTAPPTFGPGGLIRRRRRRSDRPLLGALLLAVGVVWLVDVTAIHLNGETITSLLLMLLGLGMVFTSRRGGRAWPVLLGLLLTVALVGGASTFHLDAPVSTTLDLTQLGPITAPVTFTVRQMFGRVLIVVPKEAHVDVQARVTFGNFMSPQGPRAGVGVHGDYTQDGPGTKGQLETIVVKNFAGNITVSNTLPPPAPDPAQPKPAGP